jgi:hypothetical protein
MRILQANVCPVSKCVFWYTEHGPQQDFQLSFEISFDEASYFEQAGRKIFVRLCAVWQLKSYETCIVVSVKRTVKLMGLQLMDNKDNQTCCKPNSNNVAYFARCMLERFGSRSVHRKSQGISNKFPEDLWIHFCNGNFEVDLFSN